MGRALGLSILGIPLGLAGGAVAPTVLLQDSFTDTDATALTSHTMDVGAGWSVTATASSWAISGNRAVLTKGGITRDFAWADAGQADATAQVTAQGSDNNNHPALLLRVTDGSNCWIAYLNIATDTATLFERNGGTFTSRGTSSPNLVAATDYLVAAVCSGDSIAVTIDGANAINYASASFNNTVTNFGLGSPNDTGSGTCSFEDFEVAP
jgi:hypothetical protein